MPYAEDYRPSLDKKRRKPKRSARKGTSRTPSEIGQTVPTSKKGERRKAKRLSNPEVQKIQRIQRKIRRLTNDGPEPTKATPITKEQREAYESQEGLGLSYKPPEDPIKERLARKHPAPVGLQIVRALTGDKPGESGPTLEEAINVGTTLAASGGAGALKGTARAVAAARTAKAAKEAKAVKKVAKAEKAAKTSRVKAAAKKPAKKAKARYAAPERKLRRARRAERAVVRSTDPVVVPAAASDPARAFVEGNVTADPKKAAATTARAIPASLSFVASAAGAAGKAAVTGDTSSLKGTAKAGEQALEALKPLVSGDPEKVREAVEDDVGYIFAPLAPRGIVSGPAKTLGKGVKSTAKATIKALPEPKSRVAKRAVARRNPPGKMRRAGQVVTGGRKRRSVADALQDEVRPQQLRAARREADVERKITKVSRKNRKPADNALAVLAEYGIGRKNPMENLERVKRSLSEAAEDNLPIDRVTTRRVIRLLEENPDVLSEPALWEAVDAYKKSAGEVTTSRRAQYMSQARVLDVPQPEKAVPSPARAHTSAKTREAAWADLRGKTKAAKKARKEASLLSARAKEAKGARAAELRQQAKAKRAIAKAHTVEARALYDGLKDYTRPDGKVSIQARRKMWDKQMVDEFVNEVTGRATAEGFETPAWTRHNDMSNMVEQQALGPSVGGGQTPKAVHPRKGTAEAADVVDRSYRALVSGSIWYPRMQQAVSRFVRRVDDEHSLAVGGERTFNGKRLTELVNEGKIDLRSHVPVPSRFWQQASKNADFDLDQFVTDISRQTRQDLADLDKAPGTKYHLWPREVAEEFADQLSRKGGYFEQAGSALAAAGSRTILGLSPAWALAQIGAEGMQMFAAANPARLARAARTTQQLAKKYPDEYESFAGTAGESVVALDQPHSLRIDMDGNTQSMFNEAYRGIGRTRTGKAFLETMRLRPLGLFDRWKGGKFRTTLKAANVDRELNSFLKSLSAANRQQAALAKKLSGMSRVDQLAWISRNPKELARHSRYLDDVMGNWTSFTRFEKAFAPAVMFYPFLRMSLRWTFWSYPKRHPIKAEILYFLGQRNAEEIEKITGGDASWIDYANPVVYNEDGEAEAVLPAGRRLMPGLNALTEAIGEDNIAGVFRALNPALSIPVYGLTGVDPMSGDQEKEKNRALLMLNQLLSMPAPARLAELNRVGEPPPSAISKEFDRIDPQADVRSGLMPYLPLSAERFAEKTHLSRLLDDAFGGLEITVPQTDAQEQAREEFEERFPSPDAEPTTPTRKAKRSSSSSFDSVFGGGGSSGGGSSFNRVFGR